MGIYSVISYLVAQRGRELSIRVALGASAPVVAVVTTRVLTHLLYQVSATDPVAFAGVLVALCAVALLASYLPARRAARLAPMDVLRAG